MPVRTRKLTPPSARPPGSATVPRLTLKLLAPHAIQPPERRLRKHPDRQRAAVKASIVRRGFVLPILVDRHGIIVDGVLRQEIAIELGLGAIPVIEADDLTRNERRLLSVALNKLPELAIWDEEALVLELGELLSTVDLDFTIEAIGFSTPEIDVLFDAQLSEEVADDEDFDAASEIEFEDKISAVFDLHAQVQAEGRWTAQAPILVARVQFFRPVSALVARAVLRASPPPLVGAAASSC